MEQKECPKCAGTMFFVLLKDLNAYLEIEEKLMKVYPLSEPIGPIEFWEGHYCFECCYSEIRPDYYEEYMNTIDVSLFRTERLEDNETG